MSLYSKSADFIKKNTYIENSYDVFKEKLEKDGGFYQLHWCGQNTCEERVKKETKATIRCIPFTQIREAGKCIACNSASSGRVIFSKNY